MRSLSLTMNMFFSLNSCLIMTQILICLLVFFHFLSACRFYVIHGDFSQLLHFRIGEKLPVLYMVSDGVFFILSLFTIMIKSRLYTKKHLAPWENKTWSTVIAVRLGIALLTVPLVLLSLLREGKLVERAEGGLTHAMGVYSTDGGAKELMDRAQVQYRCCGVTSYKDWLELNWYDDESPQTDSERKKHIPYSCCAPRTGTPCIHHDIFSETLPYKSPLKDREKHFWQEGCSKVIPSLFRKELRRLRIENFIILIFSLLQLFCERILQTADASVLQNGRLQAWLFPKSFVDAAKLRALRKKRKVSDQRYGGSQEIALIDKQRDTEVSKRNETVYYDAEDWDDESESVSIRSSDGSVSKFRSFNSLKNSKEISPRRSSLKRH